MEMIYDLNWKDLQRTKVAYAAIFKMCDYWIGFIERWLI